MANLSSSQSFTNYTKKGNKINIDTTTFNILDDGTINKVRRSSSITRNIKSKFPLISFIKIILSFSLVVVLLSGFNNNSFVIEPIENTKVNNSSSITYKKPILNDDNVIIGFEDVITSYDNSYYTYSWSPKFEILSELKNPFDFSYFDNANYGGGGNRSFGDIRVGTSGARLTLPMGGNSLDSSSGKSTGNLLIDLPMFLFNNAFAILKDLYVVFKFVIAW